MIWKGRHNHPIKAALLWSLGYEMLAFFGAGDWGFIHTLHEVKSYFCSTQITAAHGHLAFIGVFVSPNLSTRTYATLILKGRNPYHQVFLASF